MFLSISVKIKGFGRIRNSKWNIVTMLRKLEQLPVEAVLTGKSVLPNIPEYEREGDEGG